ncbi:hypothetical protein J7J83_04065 [bacterium]|nr:hypothetical protein [bacterium]
MNHTPKKFSFLLILSFLFVLGVGLGYGYYASQIKVNQDMSATLDQEIADITNQIEKLKSDDIVSAQTAVSALNKISSSEIEWSKVLGSVIDIAPKDLIAVRALIKFTSYSGSEGGRLNLNAQTYPSRDVYKLLNSIAKTIDAFNENPDFRDAFVPSISKSVSEDGETVLSFILSVTYKPSYTDAEASASVQRK